VRLVPLNAEPELERPPVELHGYPKETWRSPSGREMRGDNRLGLVENDVPVYPLRARASYLDEDTLALVTGRQLVLLEREPDVGFQPVAVVAGESASGAVLDDDLLLFDGRLFLVRDHALFPLPGRLEPDAVYLRGQSQGRWCFVHHDDASRWFALVIPDAARRAAEEAPRWPGDWSERLARMAGHGDGFVRHRGAIPFPAIPEALGAALGPRDLAWCDGHVAIAWTAYEGEHGEQYRAQLFRDGALLPIADADGLGGTLLHARSNGAPITGQGRLVLLQPARRRILEVDPSTGASTTLTSWDETEQLMGAACLAGGVTVVQLAGVPKLGSRRGQATSRRVLLGVAPPESKDRYATQRKRGKRRKPQRPGERMKNAARSVATNAAGDRLYTLTTPSPGAAHTFTVERFDGAALTEEVSFELPPIAPALEARSGLFQPASSRPPRISVLPDDRVFVHLGRVAFELREKR